MQHQLHKNMSRLFKSKVSTSVGAIAIAVSLYSDFSAHAHMWHIICAVMHQCYGESCTNCGPTEHFQAYPYSYFHNHKKAQSSSTTQNSPIDGEASKRSKTYSMTIQIHQ